MAGSLGASCRPYEANLRQTAVAAAESDPLAIAMVILARRIRHWEGTPTELLNELEKHRTGVGRGDPSWPKRPNKMMEQLNRMAPDLRHMGVNFERRTSKRKVITVEWIGNAEGKHNLRLLAGIDASMRSGPSTVSETIAGQGVVDAVDTRILSSGEEKREYADDIWDTEDSEDAECCYL